MIVVQTTWLLHVLLYYCLVALSKRFSIDEFMKVRSMYSTCCNVYCTQFCRCGFVHLINMSRHLEYPLLALEIFYVCWHVLFSRHTSWLYWSFAQRIRYQRWILLNSLPEGLPSLPSAWSPALGKPEAHAIIHIYRVPALGKQMALGKIWICRVPRSGHTAKPAHVLVMRDGRHVRLLCRVLPVWHSAKWDFVECLFQALGRVQFYPKKNLWLMRESRPRPPAYQKPTLTIAP